VRRHTRDVSSIRRAIYSDGHSGTSSLRSINSQRQGDGAGPSLHVPVAAGRFSLRWTPEQRQLPSPTTSMPTI
jgi:hypothetical protein